VVDERHASAALPPGKDPVTVAYQPGWAAGQVWRGAENLAPTGIRSLDRSNNDNDDDNNNKQQQVGMQTK